MGKVFEIGENASAEVRAFQSAGKVFSNLAAPQTGISMPAGLQFKRAFTDLVSWIGQYQVLTDKDGQEILRFIQAAVSLDNQRGKV